METRGAMAAEEPPGDAGALPPELQGELAAYLYKQKPHRTNWDRRWFQVRPDGQGILRASSVAVLCRVVFPACVFVSR